MSSVSIQENVRDENRYKENRLCRKGKGGGFFCVWLYFSLVQNLRTSFVLHCLKNFSDAPSTFPRSKNLNPFEFRISVLSSRQRRSNQRHVARSSAFVTCIQHFIYTLGSKKRNNTSSYQRKTCGEAWRAFDRAIYSLIVKFYNKKPSCVCVWRSAGRQEKAWVARVKETMTSRGHRWRCRWKETLRITILLLLESRQNTWKGSSKIQEIEGGAAKKAKGAGGRERGGWWNVSPFRPPNKYFSPSWPEASPDL